MEFGDELFNVFEEDGGGTGDAPEDKVGKAVSAADLVSSIVGQKRPLATADPSALEEEEVKKAKTDPETVTQEDEDDEELEANTEDQAETEGLIESAPRIRVHTLDMVGSCTHEVALPPGQDFVPLRKIEQEPAKKYPFTLDSFQQQAILCIENNQSVLVSAHTSAGKTVTAEYAIALSLKEKQRVIYTTPIKALSNQKVMREVGWVIFDEIHYMRDKERGVVWEETIILLPDNVHYVFLSATIPNARQFAEWIAHLHNQPCHVVYTEYRPTPLQHYMFPEGGDGIHLVVDEHRQFKEENFSQAMSALESTGDEANKDKRGRKGGMREGSSCFKIVKMIMERQFAPVIVFSFSKKDCEAYALQMSKLDFNSAQEKKLVDEVFQNAMTVLSQEDRSLPQVENVLPLLRRGIGIHHGGLLPILKETTEILFGEGLIKALFATETFAMGLNMPARTVLFTGAQKFDGTNMRWITSGEYIQMSGRAGRRGLDDKGVVILMVDQKMSPAIGRNLVKGAPDPINSAFRLTYNMVLNLLRVEEINPEYMMERSFHQFQNYSNIPDLYKKMKSLESDVKAHNIENEDEVASYFRLREQLTNLSQEFQSWLTKPQYVVPFMQPGRLVSVKFKDKDFGFGVVVNFKKQAPSAKSNPMEAETQYVIDVLLHVTKSTSNSKNPNDLQPALGTDDKGEMVVVPIFLNLIHQISSVRIFTPKDIRPKESRMAVQKSIKEVYKRFGESIPLLDPVKDMKINEKPFKEIMKRISAFEGRLKSHSLHSDPKLETFMNQFNAKNDLQIAFENSKADMKRAKSLLQMKDLKKMKRVLRRLGYCTASDVIEVKGRIACELSSADELLLTEMVFNGLFNELTSSQVAALLSCFVCDEKSNEMPKMTEALTGPLRQMQDMARRIAKVSKEAKINIEEDAYVETFKPFMMDIVHEWCQGSSFLNICKMTDLFEGSIIRCMRRLEELLRQMVQAAKNIGNTELENKFADSIKLLKRDIVFAASLYL
ncbi:hypothetical protein TCAL_00692 [Tigriopus californicus]|uniref:Helicase C-terminal domain-containing protein n=1 Tax=Tigriopus californicus TaxID=6832 RepID=A0A553PA55_TIGCA|nr:hypothetical protein TCAL_00692 [Tigriopus californicus]|eukprot:TCALIF_00692-PA protein Name:"Similar to Skiv2l2 Superkiller viralicidic activity 2-like 2 (Mus musculus)" AED:0.09 eAED:0.09 QI:55/0.9/0.81/1/1/1/11/0/1001